MYMLILTRRPGESLMIGDDIVITVQATKGNQVRLALDVPADIAIYRCEVLRNLVIGPRSAVLRCQRSKGYLRQQEKSAPENC